MRKLALFSVVAFMAAQTAMAQTNVTPINLTSTQQSADIVFPAPSKTYLKDIPRFDVATLKHLDKGIHSDTVRQLLGNPHFNEFISSQWNYILAIANPQTQSYTQCQLQIHFDNKKYVSDYYWNSQACANLVNTIANTSTTANTTGITANTDTNTGVIINTTAKAEPKSFVVRSDVLFAFDSSQLKSEGRYELGKLMNTIKSEYQQIDKIVVVGHSDRLGDDTYNTQLSFERANAVKNELVAYGLNGELIDVAWQGSDQPITDGCMGMSKEQAKLCLSADRRVDIYVYGALK